MPINGMILKKTGTVAVTGGTDVTYVEDAQQVANGIHVVDQSNADFRLRGNITFKVRVPIYDRVNNTWSKRKDTVTLAFPKLLASGKIGFNIWRMEREIEPESTAAEMAELNIQGAQCSFNAGLSNYWTVGTLA